MTNPTAALILFGVSALLMIVVGGPMQAADLHFGLIGSEILAMLLPAAFVAFLMNRDPSGPSALRFRRLGFGVRGIAWLIVTSALLGLAANALTGLLSEVVPGWHELALGYEAMFKALMFPESPVRRVVAVVAVVAVAPLCEETLFRGVMLPLQRDGIGNVPVVLLLNGALFSLIHLSPLNFLALLGVGAFFAHVAVLSGSIWPSIIAHATLNLVNGVITPQLLGSSTAANDPTAVTYGIAAVVLVPLVASFWFAGARRFGANKVHDA